MSFEAYDTRGVVDAPSRRVPNRENAHETRSDAGSGLSFEEYDRIAPDAATREPDFVARRRERERTPLPHNVLARAAAAAAADTLMAPVTIPARIAKAAGFPNKAAELSGAEAVADVESLLRDETTVESRERQDLGRKAHPRSAVVGDMAGEAAAGLMLGGAMKAAAAPVVRQEAARVFGGSRASQRGVATLPTRKSGTYRGSDERGAVTARDVSAALERQKSGMRPESLDYLRKGGDVRGGPVLMAEAPGEPPWIIDGRHRMTVARERGERDIAGDLIEYSPDGDVLKRTSTRFPLLSDERGGVRSLPTPSLDDLKAARAKAAETGDFKAFQRAEDEIAKALSAQRPTSATPKLADAATDSAPVQGTRGQSTVDYLRSHPKAKALDEYLRVSNGGIKGTKYEREVDTVLRDAQLAGHAKPGVTYRGTAKTAGQVEDMLRSGEISAPRPWSSTTDEDVAWSFATGRGGGNADQAVLLRIHGKTGIPVRGAGGSKHLLGEEEVLFRPNTRMKILGSERLPGGRTVIDVEEL